MKRSTLPRYCSIWGINLTQLAKILGVAPRTTQCWEEIPRSHEYHLRALARLSHRARRRTFRERGVLIGRKP